MSNESPTFEPDKLPNEVVQRIQAETDFMLLQDGYTPDEIAEIRLKLKNARNKKGENPEEITDE